MEFEFLQQARGRRQKRGWSWKRFWLAFSCGGLLLIGTISMIKAIRAGGSDEIADPGSGAPLETDAPPTSNMPPPNVLHERPGDRPIPPAVNEFLRTEQTLNSRRLELLQDQDIPVDTVDFSARCLPQWDFRKPDREVIWFYHYQSGFTQAGKSMTVFGAVDGLGSPLFQYPPASGDPLALLDSQYAALKWVALEKPAVALIVASNGPWERSGTVTDLFLINKVGGPGFWRFHNGDFEESPPCSAQLIDFRDVNGDGYRDLCAFHFTGTPGEESPVGMAYAFETTTGSFSSRSHPVSAEALSILQHDFQRIHAGETLSHPFVIGAPATTRVFTQEADPQPVSLEEAPAS